jgi:hypothetical protein
MGLLLPPNVALLQETLPPIDLNMKFVSAPSGVALPSGRAHFSREARRDPRVALSRK